MIAMEDIRYREKLDMAGDYESSGNDLHAIQIYISLFEEDENRVESYLRLIKLFERTGRSEDALKVTDKLVNTNSGNAHVLLIASEFYIFHSKWNEALKLLFKLDPAEFPLVNYWQGLCYFEIGEYETALLILQHAYKNNSVEDVKLQVLLLLAKTKYKLGDLESSLTDAELYESVDGDDWEINLLMAKIFYELGMLENAAVKIEKAFRINDSNPEIPETALKIFFKTGDIEKMEKYISLISELSPDISAEVYYLIGAVAEKKGDISNAIMYYELALKVESGFPEAKAALDNLANKNAGVI